MGSQSFRTTQFQAFKSYFLHPISQNHSLKSSEYQNNAAKIINHRMRSFAFASNVFSLPRFDVARRSYNISKSPSVPGKGWKVATISLELMWTKQAPRRNRFIVCKSSLFVIVVYTVKTMYAFRKIARGVGVPGDVRGRWYQRPRGGK